MTAGRHRQPVLGQLTEDRNFTPWAGVNNSCVSQFIDYENSLIVARRPPSRHGTAAWASGDRILLSMRRVSSLAK